MLEQFVKNCSSWETVVLKKFIKGCHLWKGSHAGTGKSLRSPLPEKEGAAETMGDELTPAHIPHSPVQLVGRSRKREIGNEVKPGKERQGKGVLRFSFYLSLLYFDLTGNKL